MEVKRGHHVGIVERGATHLGSGELHGVHVRHGRDGAGPSHLEDNLPQRSLSLLCLELVGDGPARTLGRHAEALLLGEGIDFQNHSVRCNGQVLSLLVPIVDVLEDAFQGVDQPHVPAYLEAPPGRCLKVLIVSVAWDAVA